MLFLIIFMIPTFMAITLVRAKMLFLKTLTVEFKTPWSFTIAANFLFFCDHILLSRYDWYCYIMRTFRITPLRKLWRRVSNSVLYRETLLKFLFERFVERFWVDWVFFFNLISLMLWVLSWTIVLYRRRNKFFVWTWTVKNFSYEIWSS